MYRAILVESEVHLSLLPIPNSQFPIPEDTDYGFKIHAD
jgi:hypothetical protein